MAYVNLNDSIISFGKKKKIIFFNFVYNILFLMNFMILNGQFEIYNFNINFSNLFFFLTTKYFNYSIVNYLIETRT